MREAGPSGDDQPSNLILEQASFAEIYRPEELVDESLFMVDKACARMQAAAKRRSHPDLIKSEQRVLDLRVVDGRIKLCFVASILPDARLEAVARARF